MSKLEITSLIFLVVFATLVVWVVETKQTSAERKLQEVLSTMHPKCTPTDIPNVYACEPCEAGQYLVSDAFGIRCALFDGGHP